MENEDTVGQDIAQVAARIPVLPLRDVVVYPHMVVPLFVGRDRSIKALDLAMQSDKQIMLVAQRSAEVDEPTEDDLYRVGTLATVRHILFCIKVNSVIVRLNSKNGFVQLHFFTGRFSANCMNY